MSKRLVVFAASATTLIELRAGDCIVIPPGVAHKLWADEREPLILLCCCSPAYSHTDTELLED